MATFKSSRRAPAPGPVGFCPAPSPPPSKRLLGDPSVSPARTVAPAHRRRASTARHLWCRDHR
jgi:hypothetical protein